MKAVAPMAAQAEAPQAQRWNLRRFAAMVLGVALPVFVLDQLSKVLIERHLRPFERIDLIPHLLAITYTQNPGAAFSLFAGMPPAVRNLALGGLAAGAVAVLGVLLARGSRPTLVSVAFALIMGGAAGNLVDRVLRGRVVDFIYVHYYAWSYPVFNFADSAITIGVAVILIHSLFAHDAS
ncbi:MAG TPA: signal peptidase II [Candidatus Binataceae bacterium]|nr:signal peptidase II [Candidatus Binataceae bacterium]